MKIKSIKSSLKFWQEIVFVVSVGFVLFEKTKFVVLERTMNGWEIFLGCFFLPLLICLIGQFFWKSENIAMVLSVLLGTSSFVVVLKILYYISTTSTDILQEIAMLIGGIFLIISANTMPNKFEVAPDTNQGFVK